MSHGSSSSSSFVSRSPSFQSASEPCCSAKRSSAWMSSPPSSWTPPETSETAITSAPMRVELGRRDPADVAEALDDAALVGQLPAQPLAGALDHHHHAGAGRLVAEERAAERDRLAGHDLRHGVADLHRVGVHHPGHRLLVGRHVGRRDVLLRPDDRQQLRGEAPRHLPQLVDATSPSGCSERRPSRRRRAAAGARTSRSSTSRAPRTRRARPRRRSGRRPSSGRARSSAGRGSPGKRSTCRSRA